VPAAASSLITTLTPSLTTVRHRLDGADPLVPLAVWHVLTTITDPRGRRSRRHDLATVLVLALAAMLAGNLTLAAIADWAADAATVFFPARVVVRRTCATYFAAAKVIHMGAVRAVIARWARRPWPFWVLL